MVKRIAREHSRRAEFATRFRDEADLIRRLSRGNLVATHTVGEIDGEAFIAQEYVDGHDLSELWFRHVDEDLPSPKTKKKTKRPLSARPSVPKTR